MNKGKHQSKSANAKATAADLPANAGYGANDPPAAELVACECVVLAEIKDHANWALIGECAKAQTGKVQEVLQDAYDQVEDEEDEHLYHTTGWTRELWIEALGMPAVLPPPEEVKKVETAIEAAKAKKSRAPKAKAKKAGTR